MPRYNVIHDDPAWGPGWFVMDTLQQGDVAVDVTEAEAHIIAWALNQVAEGQVLAASPMQDPPWDFASYDGPTDGVAP